MTKLIGTNPNQVPSNADLGTAAFMDKKDFLLSKGSSLSAIDAVIPKTAVDVFVYDTSKDSDGGAWRKRTQHTSWYNERLNTTTRGIRREFPAVAVIVVESAYITIYDGDDPNMPMWMVFEIGSSGMAGTIMVQGGGHNHTVAMLNGVLVDGYADEPSSWGQPIINFISEKVVRMDQQAAGSEGGIWLGNIAERNTTKGYAVSNQDYAIINGAVNDIAMTVLPNAPIDPATGLPIPTIAVATTGGVSVIKDDGTVISQAHAFGGNMKIDIRNNNLYATHNGPTSGQSLVVVNLVTLTRLNDGAGAPNHSTVNNYNDNAREYGYGLFTSNFNAPFGTVDFGVPKHPVAMPNDEVAFGQKLLMRIAEDAQTPKNSMVCQTTSDYNTGWMPGDIKLATLSDTDATNITGTELVTNGTFDTNTSGWTAYGSGSHTFSVVDNKLAVVRSSLGSGNGEPYQALTTVAGQKYVLSLDISGTTMSVVLETSIGSGTLIGSGNYPVGSHGITFTATTTTTYLRFIPDNANTTSNVDNISVRLAEPDRSINNDGLQVFGTVKKTPVAVGADLVAYSGFSASNYLQQPYNTALNFGLSSFSIMSWFKTTSQSIDQYIVDRSFDGSPRFLLLIRGTSGGDPNSFQFYVADSSSNASTITATDLTVTNNVWNHVCAVFDGFTYRIFVNGIQSTATNSTPRDISAVDSSPLHVGVRFNKTAPWAGDLALLRISATAPSAEQIRKIYEDEKFLFQENAKATLYGTSDTVTALAYDDDTNLLHAGTSAGRSVFQGLRRVDNTTDAVSTVISVINGMVAED